MYAYASTQCNALGKVTKLGNDYDNVQMGTYVTVLCIHIKLQQTANFRGENSFCIEESTFVQEKTAFVQEKTALHLRKQLCIGHNQHAWPNKTTQRQSACSMALSRRAIYL